LRSKRDASILEITYQIAEVGLTASLTAPRAISVS